MYCCKPPAPWEVGRDFGFQWWEVWKPPYFAVFLSPAFRRAVGRRSDEAGVMRVGTFLYVSCELMFQARGSDKCRPGARSP